MLGKDFNCLISLVIFHSFHHRKGWLKDFEYPPEKTIEEVDEEKLPTLCLPDQCHNYERDFVYFILPQSSDDKKIFGKNSFLSCNI